MGMESWKTYLDGILKANGDRAELVIIAAFSSIRLDALEEAAKEAETLGERYVAAAIRALKIPSNAQVTHAHPTTRKV